MRQIMRRDMAPEAALRAALAAEGVPHFTNYARLPGKPDIWIPDLNVAIFVHGCFWHRHDCQAGRRMPKTNVEYWVPKLKRNEEHDAEKTAALLAIGIEVWTMWECQVRLGAPVILAHEARDRLSAFGTSRHSGA